MCGKVVTMRGVVKTLNRNMAVLRDGDQEGLQKCL